ncbi:MAG: hypothetical protein F4210_07855 [Holophagales bacterium]|nr:hypothetical protein [Holophagales bacterium]MYF95412.1 hypothetical protein [Holophagales bacterium]
MTTSTTTAPTSPSLPFRGTMIDANRRALDFQKRVFDTSFDMVASMQERREEAISKWTENSERLPAEAKSLVQEWIRLFQDGRSSYRSAVDASFGLANSYLDSLTAQAEESS